MIKKDEGYVEIIKVTISGGGDLNFDPEIDLMIKVLFCIISIIAGIILVLELTT